MKPYYSDDLVTIYHGDSLRLLPGMSVAAGLIVTDPPYGIAWEQHGGGVTGKSRGTRKYAGIVGDKDTSARDDILERYQTIPAAVFGSWRAPQPPRTRQVLVYKKPTDAGLMGSVTGFRTDTEPVFLCGPWPHRDARWSSVLATSWTLSSLTESGHPHAKPLDVLSRLIDAVPRTTVLDPFMGSGSTLVAAKSLGRRAIGIEIEERYCEVAARRCSQEVLGLSA